MELLDQDTHSQSKYWKAYVYCSVTSDFINLTLHSIFVVKYWVIAHKVSNPTNRIEIKAVILLIA